MYIGSSPYHAPAVLTQLAHVQLGLGIYYVKGGMYKIAEAMDKLLQELGVTVHLNTPVKEITTSGAKATGITLENGENLSADIVVSNLEAIPTYRYLLKIMRKQLSKLSSLQNLNLLFLALFFY
ncbi:FAD-dependent oxidoreductase [Priestia megaterium]